MCPELSEVFFSSFFRLKKKSENNIQHNVHFMITISHYDFLMTAQLWGILGWSYISEMLIYH